MLKPGDIDVVGSIGDSLTAGVGTLTTNILTIFQQHRGVSYIIGKNTIYITKEKKL